MQRSLTIIILFAILISMLASCGSVPGPAGESSTQTETEGKVESETPELPHETETEEPKQEPYQFDGKVSEEVLCQYLSRAVTIASRNIDEWDGQNGYHIKQYIYNTGAKYIARANDAWVFTKEDDDKWGIQKTFIDEVHETDPDIVFEACIFENVWYWGVYNIPVPAYVFEAFGKEPEERCFEYKDMLFPDGTYVNQWSEFDQSVPDITQEETQMFFYYRATRYIYAGVEALQLGQIHLIGAHDEDWDCYTNLVGMIRKYASEHARRHFVFLNAHTHGITGSDGNLLLDFHMYPSRPAPLPGQKAHGPSENNPQEACFEEGYLDSIYGKSLGGKTYSGWECDALPYLVELDNFGGVNYSEFFEPTRGSIWIWGMDEISWFGSQPDWYREEFLRYAIEWIAEHSNGTGFIAMPAQREARIYGESGEPPLALMYYGYSKEFFDVANNDEWIVKSIWEDN